MATILLPMQIGTLPPGVCYPNDQARLNAFGQNLQAILSGGLAFYNFGDSTPAVEDQAYPWFRTTDGRWYFYSSVWKSPVNYDFNERRIWRGDTTELESYDGGSPGVVTSTTGPMWEVDTDFNGRSPMGVGDIPGSDPAKTLALNETYGEGSHTLTTAEMPTHTHELEFDTSDVGSGFPNASNGQNDATSYTTTEAGGDEPHQNTHPVLGCYLIKWTGRLYRVV